MVKRKYGRNLDRLIEMAHILDNLYDLRRKLEKVDHKQYWEVSIIDDIQYCLERYYEIKEGYRW